MILKFKAIETIYNESDKIIVKERVEVTASEVNEDVYEEDAPEFEIKRDPSEIVSEFFVNIIKSTIKT